MPAISIEDISQSLVALEAALLNGKDKLKDKYSSEFAALECSFATNVTNEGVRADLISMTNFVNSVIKHGITILSRIDPNGTRAEAVFKAYEFLLCQSNNFRVGLIQTLLTDSFEQLKHQSDGAAAIKLGDLLDQFNSYSLLYKSVKGGLVLLDEKLEKIVRSSFGVKICSSADDFRKIITTIYVQLEIYHRLSQTGAEQSVIDSLSDGLFLSVCQIQGLAYEFIKDMMPYRDTDEFIYLEHILRSALDVALLLKLFKDLFCPLTARLTQCESNDVDYIPSPEGFAADPVNGIMPVVALIEDARQHVSVGVYTLQLGIFTEPFKEIQTRSSTKKAAIEAFIGEVQAETYLSKDDIKSAYIGLFKILLQRTKVGVPGAKSTTGKLAHRVLNDRRLGMTRQLLFGASDEISYDQLVDLASEGQGRAYFRSRNKSSIFDYSGDRKTSDSFSSGESAALQM